MGFINVDYACAVTPGGPVASRDATLTPATDVTRQVLDRAGRPAVVEGIDAYFFPVPRAAPAGAPS